MQSRKNLFLFFCLDFIVFLFVKLYKSQQEISFQNTSLTFLLSIAWGLISYINGKYSYFTHDEYLFKKLYRLLKSNLISLTLIYLMDKVLIVFFPGIIPFGKNKIILLGLISFILQSLKFFIYKIKNKKIIIYLIGNNSEKDTFKNLTMHKNIQFINKLPIYKGTFENITILTLNSSKNYNNINKDNPNLKIKVLSPFKWCEQYLNRIPIEYLNSDEVNKHNWFIEFDSFNWRLKRFGDVILSFLLMIITIPLIAIFSLLIYLEDRGPAFYSQIRTGINGKEFKITKLRTMKHNSEKFGPVWATKNDKRITKIGSFLRKTRMDELPQLASVLIGDMSLIGPRPERPEIEISLKKNIPFYEMREVIKPGLSGWAQVNYPYGASIQDSKIKFSYELFYIINQSFWLDLLIFIKTIKLIITMKGAKPKR